jgi:hypothetical protein
VQQINFVRKRLLVSFLKLDECPFRSFQFPSGGACGGARMHAKEVEMAFDQQSRALIIYDQTRQIILVV